MLRNTVAGSRSAMHLILLNTARLPFGTAPAHAPPEVHGGSRTSAPSPALGISRLSNSCQSPGGLELHSPSAAGGCAHSQFRLSAFPFPHVACHCFFSTVLLGLLFLVDFPLFSCSLSTFLMHFSNLSPVNFVHGILC